MARKDDTTRAGGRDGITRRGFLTSFGAGVVGMAAVRADGSTRAQEAATDAAEGGLQRVQLLVNGRPRRLLVEPRRTLADVLRNELGLTATKISCARGECGACTVLLDGRPRYSCMTLAVEAEGRRITSLEGLMDGEELGAVQRAFAETDAFQCGYCTPGQVVSVEGLLRRSPAPTLDEVRRGVSGNLCRCGAYRNIFRAALRAAELRRA